MYSSMFLSLNLFFVIISFVNSHPQEKHLLRSLLHDYESRIIPDSKEPLQISNDMRIYILVGVDEQQESIRLLLWSAQKWNDSSLKWNTSFFDGLEEINIPASDLWLPDWHIFNLVDSKDSVELSRTNARVNFKGEVAVDFYKFIEFRCELNVLNFPFDIQNCSIVLGTWSYSIQKLKFIPASTVYNMTRNSEWDIIDFTAQEMIKTFDGVDYQEIHYYLIIKRKALFYIVTLIFPTYLIVTVSIIGLFVPHSAGGEREEKVTFGLTTLLTLCIMLQMLSTEMPRSADGLPILGSFLVFECVISVVALATSVFLLCLAEYTIGKRPWTFLFLIFDESVIFAHENNNNSDETKQHLLKSKALNYKQSNGSNSNINGISEILQYYHEKRESKKEEDIWRKFYLTMDILLCFIFIGIHSIFCFVIFYPFKEEIMSAVF